MVWYWLSVVASSKKQPVSPMQGISRSPARSLLPSCSIVPSRKNSSIALRRLWTVYTLISLGLSTISVRSETAGSFWTCATSVPGISKQLRNRKHSFQYVQNDFWYAILILDSGGVNEPQSESLQPLCHVPLAASDLLARIVTARSSAFCCFDARTVNHGNRMLQTVTGYALHYGSQHIHPIIPATAATLCA